LFAHGGGFCLNKVSTNTHHVFCERWASAGFFIASVDYRLAPEHKFPCGITDCYDALVWLTSDRVKPHIPAHVDVSQLILAGDSAGGNFTAVLSSLVRDRLDVNLRPTNKLDHVHIVHQVVIYGAFFHHPLLPSMLELAEEKRTFSFLSRDCVHCFAAYYAPNNDASLLALDRRCAPMLAGTAGLPRTTVFTADDPLKDENLLYVQQLTTNNVPVKHVHYDHCHGYMTFEFLEVSDLAFNDLLLDLAYLTHA
jgi:acetyl esterase